MSGRSGRRLISSAPGHWPSPTRPNEPRRSPLRARALRRGPNPKARSRPSTRTWRRSTPRWTAPATFGGCLRQPDHLSREEGRHPEEHLRRQGEPAHDAVPPPHGGQAAREEILAETVRAYATLRDERLNVVEAMVKSAQPLAHDEADRLRQRLETQSGKKVRLRMTVEPSLMGGARRPQWATWCTTAASRTSSRPCARSFWSAPPSASTRPPPRAPLAPEAPDSTTGPRPLTTPQHGYRDPPR